MTNTKTIAVATVLGFAICSTTIAQDRPDRSLGKRPPNARTPAGARQRPTEAAPAIAHFTEAFATVAPFDANQDGQLDATERATLAKAMAEGTVQAPAHRTPPAGITPSPRMIINQIATLYSLVAPFDANHDGSLDENEQGALAAASKRGELPRPGGPPVGVGGPDGKRPPGPVRPRG